MRLLAKLQQKTLQSEITVVTDQFANAALPKSVKYIFQHFFAEA
jgi:hypothetical protein